MDFLEQTVRNNWQRLATLGWHKYLKHGKGILLLVEQGFGLTEVVYVSFQQLAEADPEIYSSINSSVTKYNPETSFIICHKPISGNFTWRMIHSPELKNAEVARLQDEGILVEYQTIVRS